MSDSPRDDHDDDQNHDHDDDHDDARDEDRVDTRAELLPEERKAGSDDPHDQAAAILEESDERTDQPEETRRESTQTPGPSDDETGEGG